LGHTTQINTDEFGNVTSIIDPAGEKTPIIMTPNIV
jgi:YD repeat-containing protein